MTRATERTQRVEAAPPVVRRWQRPASGFYVASCLIGYRYVIEGPGGIPVRRGWRPTLGGAKRAAKCQLRAATIQLP